MADRVKTWDVEVDQKLRRSVGAHDQYTDDTYYTRWIRGGRGNFGNGSYSSLYGIMQSTSFPAGSGVVQFSQTGMELPAYWTKGKIELWSYYWSSSTGGAIDVGHELGFIRLPDDAASQTAAALTYPVPKTYYRARAVGSNPLHVIVDESAVVTRGINRWIAIEFNRDQSSGSSQDDGVSNCHHVAWKVVWKPELRQ